MTQWGAELISCQDWCPQCATPVHLKRTIFEFIPDSYLTVLSLMSLGILKPSLAMSWLVCQAYCGEAYIYFRIISNDGKAISYSGVHLQGDFFSLVPP